MQEDDKAVVPVWMLNTGGEPVPEAELDSEMTPERLSELRSALAALAKQPVVTLEAYRAPEKVDRGRGHALSAASPLARDLSQLIQHTARNSEPMAKLAESGEVLYRMVVPAKVAAQLGQGAIQPMASKAAAGGIYSALMGSSGIAAKATFVPVTKATGLGAAGGVGAAAAGGAAVGGTIIAPLVLMAVAVGVTAHAERKRQEAIDHITDLLEQLHDDKLDDERNALDGCRGTIDKATSILLDQGKLGVSLGLDSAVHAISTAMARVERRLKKWEESLDGLPERGPVLLRDLIEAFPGIEREGGEFQAHVELAALSIALKQRVIVLQAVEHAQRDSGNPFQNFLNELSADRKSIEEMQARIMRVFARLGSIELSRPRGIRVPAFSAKEVDRLLRAQNKLHTMGYRALDHGAGEIAIDMIRSEDGSLVVLPADLV